MKKDEKLSIVVPCYNEEKKIYSNLLKLSKIIAEFSKNYEIICVNDGSTDCSKKEIHQACKKDGHIHLKSYDINRGKGYALKIGVAEAEGDLIGFIDCDLELSPSYIKDYIEIMKEEKADAVIASKMHKDSKISYPLNRRILSLGYYVFLKSLFRLKVKDTQTGLKLFKRNIIKPVMEKVTINGFAFDIEVLALINKNGRKIVDAPIELDFTRGHSMGRIKLKDITKMFRDTIKIFYKINIKHAYDGKLEKEQNNMRRIYFFIGTEAELMKMYNIILEAKKRGYRAIIVSNGQNDIKYSPFLDLINGKIDIDLTKYIPNRKGMLPYLKWFIKTRRYGIKVFRQEKKKTHFKDSMMIVHGDTLSTLMGSSIAKKVGLKYGHVESGIRSFNWFSPFPEEIDRYFSSLNSIVNFCQKDEAAEYAAKKFKGEAVNTKYNTGIETLYYALDQCKKQRKRRPIKEDYFVYAIHRQENLLNATFMKNVTQEILKLSKKIHCLFIYHNQTRETMEKFGIWKYIQDNPNITIIGRQDYINFINIIRNCKFVIGDGCGNQQEFYYLGKPYLIMRTKVEENSEGLNWNALPFHNDFSNISKFYKNYKKYEKPPVEMEVRPSVIVMDKIDEIFASKMQKKN